MRTAPSTEISWPTRSRAGSAVGVPRAAGPEVSAGRSFSLAQWQFIAAQLKMLPATSANQRLFFLLHLLYATGLRLPKVEAPGLNKWQRLGLREAIAASTFYDPV